MCTVPVSSGLPGQGILALQGIPPCRQPDKTGQVLGGVQTLYLSDQQGPVMQVLTQPELSGQGGQGGQRAARTWIGKVRGTWTWAGRVGRVERVVRVEMVVRLERLGTIGRVGWVERQVG